MTQQLTLADKFKLHPLILSLIAKINEEIEVTINTIIHLPAYQKLEAAWYGLLYLTKQNTDKVVINILHLPFVDLQKDVRNHSDFHDSVVYRLIYNDAFDSPGGKPFGLLIGDYYFSHTDNSGLECLNTMGHICSEAFSPFITSVDKEIFSVTKESEIDSLDLAHYFKSPSFDRFKKLTSASHFCFIGLTLPQTIMREPCGVSSQNGSNIQERIIDKSDYLWGNSAYIYGAMIIAQFSRDSWFLTVQSDQYRLNPVTKYFYSSDVHKVIQRQTQSYRFTDVQRNELSNMGLITLKDNVWDSSVSVSSQMSIYQASQGGEPKLCGVIPYLLCASRFAHCLKVLLRQKIGAFVNAGQCEKYIQSWLYKFCSATNKPNSDGISYPLKQAQVKISSLLGSQDCFSCSIIIRPHAAVNFVDSDIKLKTSIKLS